MWAWVHYCLDIGSQWPNALLRPAVFTARAQGQQQWGLRVSKLHDYRTVTGYIPPGCFVSFERSVHLNANKLANEIMLRLGNERLMFSGLPSVRPFSSAWRDISVHSGEISIKLGTHIHRDSKHCWKKFPRSIARPNALLRRRLSLHFDGVASRFTYFTFNKQI